MINQLATMLRRWQSWAVIAAIALVIAVAWYYGPDLINARASLADSGDKPLRFPVPGYKVGRDYYASDGRHKGWDISAPLDTAIYSPGDGTVRFAGSRDGSYGGLTSCGRYVEVWFDNLGLLISFCHMNRTARGIKAGDKVTTGQLLGYVGVSGNVLPKDNPVPHLHLTGWKGGKTVDLTPYMPKEG